MSLQVVDDLDDVGVGVSSGDSVCGDNVVSANCIWGEYPSYTDTGRGVLTADSV